MKQFIKSKTIRKSTRRKSKTRRNKRMMTGGNTQITLGITYDKILEYLLELLNRPDFKRNVLEKNKKFIQSISINNDNFSVCFDFSNNVDFRKFINDLIQWLLFDYNPYILDTLLTVIYSCFDDPDFLNKNVDSLQILFEKLQDMIVYNITNAKDDKDKINEINLLTLILYVLTIPGASLAVSNLINNNKDAFGKNVTDIKCVLKEITYKKINTPSIRNAISNYFDSFNPKIRYTEIPGLVGNIARCLPNLLNSFATNFVTATGSAVRQKFSENIIQPGQSVFSQVRSNIPSLFRMPIPQ